MSKVLCGQTKTAKLKKKSRGGGGKIKGKDEELTMGRDR